jgi:hypothetical protein
MKKKLSMLFGLIMIASMILSACATPTAVTERIVETVVVTQLVEREGETVVETKIIEVLITPTPNHQPASLGLRRSIQSSGTPTLIW